MTISSHSSSWEPQEHSQYEPRRAVRIPSLCGPSHCSFRPQPPAGKWQAQQICSCKTYLHQNRVCQWRPVWTVSQHFMRFSSLLWIHGNQWIPHPHPERASNLWCLLTWASCWTKSRVANDINPMTLMWCPCDVHGKPYMMICGPHIEKSY